MRLVLAATLLLTGSVLVAGSGASAQLRCGGGIVSPSASLERVATVCGEPDDRSERIEVRRSPGRRCSDGSYRGGTSRIVHIESWVFDFGPERLVQALTFEDGTLVRIESRGYGKGRPRDARLARAAQREWVLLPRSTARLRRRGD